MAKKRKNPSVTIRLEPKEMDKLKRVLAGGIRLLELVEPGILEVSVKKNTSAQRRKARHNKKAGVKT